LLATIYASSLGRIPEPPETELLGVKFIGLRSDLLLLALVGLIGLISVRGRSCCRNNEVPLK
jgi:hypothetical protein